MADLSSQNMLWSAERLLKEVQSDEMKIAQIRQEYAKGGVTVQQEKSKFLKIKYVLMETEARFAFLQKMMLDKQQWQNNQGDTPLTEICAQLKSAKEEKDTITEEISQSIELSFQANAKLQDKIQEMEKLVKELKQNRDKLEVMKVKVQTSQLADGNLKDHLQAQRNDLSWLENSLRSANKSLESAKQERDSIKMSSEKLRQDIQQSTEILKADSEKIQSGYDSQFSRVEKSIELINKLDGVTLDVHHMDKSNVVIEFINTENHRILPSLFVNIQYSMRADDNMHIKSVTVNLDSFSVDDLVASERHSVPSFIHKVHKRWQNCKQEIS